MRLDEQQQQQYQQLNRIGKTPVEKMVLGTKRLCPTTDGESGTVSNGSMQGNVEHAAKRPNTSGASAGSAATANNNHSTTNGSGGEGRANAGEQCSTGNAVGGNAGDGSQSNGTLLLPEPALPNGVGAEAGEGTDSGEPVPNRLKPHDPDLQVMEVTNDGDAANMEMLIHLKEIFHAQLPKMPKEYIVRLVFDRKHRSIVLCKKGVPIGGITYRPFKEQKFGEIAFCAVVGNAQVQGHGSRLMNELKKVAVRTDITHFHTYADNYAIGYFAKHGFTKQLTMSRDRWVSYVKDYDGGTHMECYVHPTIPYLQQPAMFARQRDWLVRRIAEVSTSTRVHEGLPASTFHDGRLTNRADIPGVLEAGWTEEELKAQSRRKSDRDSNTTNKELIALWREIERNDNAWPFRDPVDLQEVTDYTKVVAHPMDLSQIRDNLDEIEPKPYYDSKERLKIDLDLMIKNCKTYNAESTDYWAAADALEGFINDKFRAIAS